jgi:hypothetical protein
MDLEQRIKKELHISKMPIDAILKTARPIWEVMGISEEKYFDLYMVLEDPRNTPEPEDDKEVHEIAENAEQLSIGETCEDVQAES